MTNGGPSIRMWIVVPRVKMNQTSQASLPDFTNEQTHTNSSIRRCPTDNWTYHKCRFACIHILFMSARVGSITKGRVHPRLPPYQRKPNIGSSRRQDFQHPQHPTSALSFCMRATSCKPPSFPNYAYHEPETQRKNVSGHCKLPFCERCDHRGPLPFLLVPCVFWLLLVTRSGLPNSRLATALLSNPWMTNSALPHSELASHQYFAIALERARCRLAIAHWNSAVSKSAAELQGATSCLGLGSNCRFAGLERCASSLLLAAESLALVVGEERRGEELCGLSSGLLP